MVYYSSHLVIHGSSKLHPPRKVYKYVHIGFCQSPLAKMALPAPYTACSVALVRLISRFERRSSSE
jgi:hypothetical protein